MKKSHYFLIFFATLFSMAYGQIQLSTYSEVSILTIGPGTSLNDAFGHSAIRIKDPMYRLDIVYDYGRYDFESDGFYLNFAKGKLNYEIGFTNYKPFLSYYLSEEREVKSQTLNLSLGEKQAFFQKLQQNILPQRLTLEKPDELVVAGVNAEIDSVTFVNFLLELEMYLLISR